MARAGVPFQPVALRAAHLKSETEPNDADSLRSRVASYLDQRVTPPPQDPYLSPRSRKRPLYNQVVRIIDKPPCYEAKYWFVYQYVPDMEEICHHLCPWRRTGCLIAIRRARGGLALALGARGPVPRSRRRRGSRETREA